MSTVPESHRDLVESQIGSLGTVDAQGRPQVSPIWFLYEDDTLRFSLNTNRQKTRNLQRNPVCTFLILDATNPYRYLELRGVASIEDDPDFVFADKVGLKYGTKPTAFDQPGEVRVKVTVDVSRVVAVDMAG